MTTRLSGRLTRKSGLPGCHAGQARGTFVPPRDRDTAIMKTPFSSVQTAPSAGSPLAATTLDAATRSLIARQQSLISLAMVLGRTIFSLDSVHIVDIVGREAMTHCPGLPEFISGIVDSRGTAVPVVRLDAPADDAATLAPHTHVVVLETKDGSEAIGILLGSIEDVGAMERIDLGAPRQQ